MTKFLDIHIVGASLGARPDYQPPVRGERPVLLSDLLRRLDEAQAARVPVVFLTIDSKGGEAAAGFALFHALRCFSEDGGKVVAYVEGIAGSAAPLYLLAADYVVADELSAFAVHSAFGDAPAVLDDLGRVQRALLEARTTAPADVVSRWCKEREVQFFGPRQAQAWGFVDAVGGRRMAREIAHRLALGADVPSTRPQADPVPVRQYGAMVIDRLCELSPASAHLTNIIPSATRIPLRFLAPAMVKFGTERLGLLDRIYEKSPYMYERIHDPEAGLGKSIMELTIRSGLVGYLARDPMTGKTSYVPGSATKLSDDLRRVGMYMIHGITTATAIPAWWGSYEHATAPVEKGGLGLGEADAVMHADQTVRQTQTSYRNIDRSQIERSQVGRYFTMFYGYLNSQLNLFFSTSADARLRRLQGVSRTRILSTVAYNYGLLAANAVLAEALTGKGAPDYDNNGEVDADDWARWAAMQALFAYPNTLPFGRSFVDAVSGSQGREVSLTPWTRVWTSAATAIREAEKAGTEEAHGDEVYKAALAALEAYGWYRGLPVAQLRRTGDYWTDITPEGIVESPEAQRAGGAEAAYGTAYGPKKRGRVGQTLFGK